MVLENSVNLQLPSSVKMITHVLFSVFMPRIFTVKCGRYLSFEKSVVDTYLSKKSAVDIFHMLLLTPFSYIVLFVLITMGSFLRNPCKISLPTYIFYLQIP